ncbi:MAG TPA: serine/threonine-protein kinase [Gemmataceae bacterium]|nr:serine/threonine-protein kinase [Gemmataceae bacterium]
MSAPPDRPAPDAHRPEPVPGRPGDDLTLPRPEAGPDGLATLPEAAHGPRPGDGDRPALPGYEILGELGRGSMGVVYRARQASLDRLVALKVILAGAHAGADERARFRREAEAVARFQHAHIVQVFEVGEHHGLPFFSLEFCPGGGLDGRLHGTPLPPKEAAALVEKLARAVHAAHQKGIVHRDLKPANVLLAEDGTPKIADFGLAKTLDEAGQTASGAVLGTPSYMAPEQARGKGHEAGPAVDTYALGAVLYECLTGRPPFKAATTADTLLQVIGDEPVPPSRLAPAVPPDLETVCLKCLQKEPARRYLSALELADDLGRFLAGEPVRARPAGRLERAAKWARRRPAAAALLGVCVLAALLVIGLTGSFLLVLARNNEELARLNEDLTAKTRLAEEEAERVKAARDELEVTLAENLMRPVGLDRGSPGPFECESLWKLATLSNARVRLRFLERALAAPDTAERLARRADMALLAALGLDPDRRKEASRLLLAALAGQQPDPRTRQACLQLGMALAETDRVFVREVVRALPGASAAVEYPDAFQVIRTLERVAELLTKEEASAAAIWLGERIGMRPEAFSIDTAVRAFEKVAPQLEPAERRRLAGHVARRLTEQFRDTTDAEILRSRAAALKAVVAHLDAGQVAGVAATVLDQLGQTNYPFALRSLAIAFAVVAERMEPAEARRLARTALPSLVEKAARQRYAYPVEHVARAVAAVAGVLDPAEARKPAVDAATRLVEHIAQSGSNPPVSFRDALKVVAGAGGPEGTAAVIARLVERIAQSTDPRQVTPLLLTLQALQPRPGAAEGVAAVVALLGDRATQDTNPREVAALALALQAVQPRPGGAEARKLTATATRLLGQLDRATDREARLQLLYTLEVLTRSLDSAESRKTLGAVVECYVRQEPARAHEWISYFWTIRQISRRLDPAEARRLLGPAARHAVARLPRVGNRGELTNSAWTLAEAAPYLEPAEVRERARAIALRLGEQLDQAPEAQLDFVAQNVGTLTYLAPYLDREAAAAVAARVARRLCGTAVRDASFPLARALGALAGRLDSAESNRLAGEAALHLIRSTGRASDDRHLNSARQALTTMAGHLGREEAGVVAGWFVEQTGWMPAELLARLDTQQLVDLLKRPTFVGAYRATVLDRLGQQLGRPFSSAWELSDWLRQNRPDVDLRSPPRRPEAL